MFRVVYQSSFEEGFYDFEGTGELTIPNGWSPGWDGDKARPEYDKKDNELGQPEVNSGRYAASIFHTFNLIDGVLYKQFSVAPNRPFRVSVYCMGVASEGAGFGMVLGIDPLGTIDFREATYGDWWSTHMPEYENRVWKKLTVEASSGPTGEITVFLRVKNDYAEQNLNSHWDDVLVEIDDEAPPVGGDLVGHLDAIQEALNLTYAYVQLGAKTLRYLPVEEG